MTRRDFILKWLLYALALLPILALQLYVLPWAPIFGTVPNLLPVAAVTLTVLEGMEAGGCFGLAAGILSDALIPGLSGPMTVGLALMGMCAGATARYGLRQNLLSCLICSAGALTIINLFRVLYWLLNQRASLPELLRVAVPEILLSLVFLPLIYGIFKWVWQRVPRVSVL